ncbi:formylglycine-generating enzyme family protein [Nitrospira sp. BLG_1]|uniref:formylglycine-generating enzyme family protein n=1 Tax=Nitrospira sp. BLG_1 TaxID=3395883 RepID=UPI0039BD8994
MFQLEEIVDLADHLRGADYQPTLHQVLAAQTVIRQASLQDSGLGSLVRLSTVLRPIFSATPDQQERFEKVYLDWLRARSNRPPTISVNSPPILPPKPPRIHWRMKLVVPCLLIALALTAWFLWQDLRAREAVGRVVAENQPIAQAIVKLGNRTVRTDEQGAFKIPFNNSGMPQPLLVEMKGYLPNQSLVGETILANRSWLYLSPVDLATQFEIGEVQLVKDTPVPVPPTRPPAIEAQLPRPTLNLETIPGRKLTIPPWWDRLSYPTSTVVLTPGLLVLVWFLYRFSRRAVLKRQSSLIAPELKQIHIQAATQHLFPSLSLRYVTQRLRQRRFEESAELDVARTIHLTINRGGLFAPVFGSKREPSYVALIDRATMADHQASMAAQVVKDLVRGNVLLRQFEFDEQPTILRNVDPLHAKLKQREEAISLATRLEIISLGEVTAKFATSRLLYFAEPITYFDRLTGKLRPWVETLEAWDERFLFTSDNDGQWGQAARILSRRGFHIIPLTHLGLKLFPHLLEQKTPQGESTEATAGKRWGTYGRTPQRWLERHPPSPEIIAKLMADLRQDLGPEGMLWMTACAAYPEIHWALTLEWGVRLFGHGHATESLLPKLVSLVWFRHAFMPDWFRAALYDQLTAQEAERISQELSEIISALNPESGDSLQLKIATPSGARQQPTSQVGAFRGWLQKFHRRSVIQAMGRAAEPGNPTRDYVMLQYLSGKQGKAITPYAPKALLTLLFPKGQPWLGFRPLFLVIVAYVLSAGLWWWQDPAPLPIPSPIVDIAFLPGTIDVILKREDGSVERWGEKEKELVRLESGRESVLADRLAKVKTNQLTVPDPENLWKLLYQKEGLLYLKFRDNDEELLRESVPSSEIASLFWPTQQDAFLAVISAGVPELLKIKGLTELIFAEAKSHPRGFWKEQQELSLLVDKLYAEALTAISSLKVQGGAPRKKQIQEARDAELTPIVGKLEAAYEGARKLHAGYVGLAVNSARAISQKLSREDLLTPVQRDLLIAAMARKRMEYGVAGIEVFSNKMETLTRALDAEIPTGVLDLPISQLVLQVLTGKQEFTSVQEAQTGRLVRAAISVVSASRRGEIEGVVVVETYVPESLLTKMETIGQQYMKYKKMTSRKKNAESAVNSPTRSQPAAFPQQEKQNVESTMGRHSASEPADLTQKQAIQSGEVQSVDELPSQVTGKGSAPITTAGDNPSSLQATGFQVSVNHVYNHPSVPVIKFVFNGEIVLVVQEGNHPILLARSQLSSFPDGQWVSLQGLNQYLLPIMVMRSDRSLKAQWLSSGPAQQQATKQTEQPPQDQVAEKYPHTVTGKDDAPMVLIPAGEFIMGFQEEGKSVRYDERPVRPVYLNAYYIDQYEVTTTRYFKFFQETKHPAPEYWNADLLERNKNKPVVGVDWHDAAAYCAWAGKRLPTEAEWEKAARGTDQRLHPWGNEALTNENLANLMRGRDNYISLVDVGSFEQGKSPYGVYDMEGNVWEWTADVYLGNHDYDPKKTQDLNHKVASNEAVRSIRGGQWDLGPVTISVVGRGADRSDYRHGSLGFRCAQDAPK